MNAKVRRTVKAYHDNLYKTTKLFQKGTWLEKPEPEILAIVDTYFASKENVSVLDLGSGIGRNAIPVAQKIAPRGGRIACVDYLDVAIEKLHTYAVEFGVENAITGIISEIEKFTIEPNEYDFIIAHSTLNHVSTLETMQEVIQRMKTGTKPKGIHYISISTDVSETDVQTRKLLSTDVEVVLTEKETSNLFRDAYKAWKTLKEYSTPYEERYMRDGKDVFWKATFFSIIVQKQ